MKSKLSVGDERMMISMHRGNVSHSSTSLIHLVSSRLMTLITPHSSLRADELQTRVTNP